MNRSLRDMQEEGLREQARGSRRYHDLLYFYAVARNFEAIKALAPALEAEEDLLIARLFSDPDAPLARELPQSFNLPWLNYTLIKALIQANRLTEVTPYLYASLENDPPDLFPLNLFACYLASKEMRDQALELAGISLSLSPHQEDIIRLANGLELGHTPRLSLYLNPLPKAVSLTYYLPAFKVQDYIDLAIRGLIGQNYPLDELLVVDDASPDRSIEIARQYPVRILHHAENRGLAAVRNTAFAHTKTPLVGAIDTDAWPEPEFSQYALLALENADPRIVGVGGRLIEKHQESPADQWRYVHMNQEAAMLRLQSPLFLYGSNTLYYRARVLEVGGYDESCRNNAEDADISRKLQTAGYGLLTAPQARIFHMRQDSPASVLHTYWNWAAKDREKTGTLRSLSGIQSEMLNILQRSINLINHDMREGRSQSIYIDFLYIFHESIWNYYQAAQRGIIPLGLVRTLAMHLMETLSPYPRVKDRVEGDLKEVMEKLRGPTLPFSQAQQRHWARFEQALQEVYQAMPDSVLSLLAG